MEKIFIAITMLVAITTQSFAQSYEVDYLDDGTEVAIFEDGSWKPTSELITKDTEVTNSTKTKEICKELGDIAELVMKERQNGVPMYKMLDRFNSSAAGNHTLRALSEEIIKGAYNIRISSNKFDKDIITEEYSFKVEKNCYISSIDKLNRETEEILDHLIIR